MKDSGGNKRSEVEAVPIEEVGNGEHKVCHRVATYVPSNPKSRGREVNNGR